MAVERFRIREGEGEESRRPISVFLFQDAGDQLREPLVPSEVAFRPKASQA